MKSKIFSKITSSILLCTILTYTTAPVFAYTKDETVYSKLDSNGKTYETLVSNHLVNSSNDNLINDISDLFEIKNVNGDENFTKDGKYLVWNAEGRDIYYQGKSQKDLPIDCKIKYELNGEEILSQDLAGKSGNVKITIEYINKDEHLVNINGKSEKLYTPFIVMLGTIIDNETNKNIKISTGKVIDDGSKSIVIGITLPGLQESLDIESNKLEIPSKLEITMDTTDFKLGNIATFVTPKLIEDNDLTLFDNLDSIYANINTLQTSSNQLENGANTLANGTKTYVEKSNEFSNGMKEVSDGINSAYENYSKIDEGIDNLYNSTGTLVSGAKQVFDGVKSVNSYLSEISTGASNLYSGLNQLESQVSQLTGDKSIATIVSELTNATKKAKAGYEQLEKLESSYLSQLAKLQNDLKSASSEGEREAIQLQIDIYTDLQKNIATAKGTLNAQIAVYTKLGTEFSNGDKSTLTALSKGVNQLAQGANKLSSGASTLSSSSKKLESGAKSLYDGADKLSNGVNTLHSGSKEMKNGLYTLNQGATKLYNANVQLVTASKTISDGASTLSNGITKFNKEGIQTLCNYIGGDLKDISLRFEKLQELSNEYNNFTAIDDKASRKC